jgi:hypothetical protein
MGQCIPHERLQLRDTGLSIPARQLALPATSSHAIKPPIAAINCVISPNRTLKMPRLGGAMVRPAWHERTMK